MKHKKFRKLKKKKRKVNKIMIIDLLEKLVSHLHPTNNHLQNICPSCHRPLTLLVFDSNTQKEKKNQFHNSLFDD